MTDRLEPLHLPDLTGRIALVTGGSSGLGLETAAALAAAGAEVVLTSRSGDRAADAAALVRATSPRAVVHAEALDTSSFTSVEALASRWVDRPLSFLVLNAGSAAPAQRAVSVDGHEWTMATNALGHVRLTHALAPALRAASGRVVTVSSVAALWADADVSDLELVRGWTRSQAYARSKFACLVLGLELPSRAGVGALPAHPGFATTAFFGPGRSTRLAGALSTRLRIGQSARDGAQPLLAAAAGRTDLAGSTGYLGPEHGLTGRPGPATLPRPARDPGVRAAWWAALCLGAGVPQVWTPTRV